VAVGCGVATGSVSSTSQTSETEGALPSGWVVFEGDSISLALPDSFVGGTLTDSTVVSIPTAMGLDPESFVTTADVELIMFGEPNAVGHRANVTAVRNVLTPPTMSMEECVQAFFSELPEAELEPGSVTEDRAYAVLRSETQLGATLQHIALGKAGSYLYSVQYTFDDPLNTSLDSVFRTSADTIVVKEQ
jgi:hypothetical protein